MLPDFRIQNFRCFRDLHLKGLGRVNLLVGKNNTGKSTVLEALSLWAKNGSPEGLVQVLEAREGPLDEVDSQTWYAILESLFLSERAAMRMGPSTEKQELAVEIRVGAEPGPVPGLLAEEKRRQQVAALVTDGGHGRFVSPAAHQVLRLSGPALPTRCEAILLPVSGLDATLQTRLWSDIAGFPAEDDLISALRVLEPEIERVYHLGGTRFRLKRHGKRAPEPLSRFGDGMRRVLELALALVSVPGGLLLIDEFENGVHHEVQEPLWRWLIEVATRLDVQVFATTHSLDCVRGFTAAVVDHPEAGALYRLAQWRGEIMAFGLDEQDLATAARHTSEVR